MVSRIAEDYDVTWDDVLAQSGGVSIGRPHIADALVARGIVRTRSEAFETILHFRAGYYLPALVAIWGFISTDRAKEAEAKAKDKTVLSATP